jgi:hypothetical protein
VETWRAPWGPDGPGSFVEEGELKLGAERWAEYGQARDVGGHSTREEVA